ncbi:MAG TPA: protein kinase, partial [Polyangiaceae bacterium]|nr:protein kinase [Polyangiaceae bacterium]
GGMGAVYRAHDCSSAGDLGFVVVKLLNAGVGDRRRFLTEARAARCLTSAHAVRVYDFGFDGSMPFMVMELLRGRTLRDVLRAEGKLDEARARDITLQVCQALEEAHEAGVIHRDLKPDNLMLLAPDHRFVKVLDFGAARLIGTDTTGSIIGTPHYMAPEQFDRQDIDARVDIYALGVCLYEMLTGRPPFRGETAYALMHAHQQAPVPDLEASHDFQRTVEWMLAKDRRARPQTAGEVAAALGAPQRASVHSFAPNDMALARTASIETRTRWYRPGLVGVAVAAVAVLLFATLRRDEAREEAPSAASAPVVVESTPPIEGKPSASSRPEATPIPSAAPPRKPVRRIVGPVTSSSAAPAPATSSPRAGRLREDEF